MPVSDCVSFLQWSLPRLHYRWAGFRKVRGQVCKRILRRIRQLDLLNYDGYKYHLENHELEWDILDSYCRITISRFYRDKKLWEQLQKDLLPSLAKQVTKDGESELNCWSIGCCNGEEPYTLNIIWNLFVKPETKSKINLKILATDSDPNIIGRAEQGRYSAGSLKDFPKQLTPMAFTQYYHKRATFLESQQTERRSPKQNRVENGNGITSRKVCYKIRDEFRENVIFKCQDIRREMPKEKFRLVFCRNLVFTYFDEELQAGLLKKVGDKLFSNGYLIIGRHESLPLGSGVFVQYDNSGSIFRKE